MSAKANESGGAQMGYIGGRAGFNDSRLGSLIVTNLLVFCRSAFAQSGRWS